MKAEKGKRGTDDITKYFVRTADTSKLRPTKPTAALLDPSVSKPKE